MLIVSHLIRHVICSVYPGIVRLLEESLFYQILKTVVVYTLPLRISRKYPTSSNEHTWLPSSSRNPVSREEYDILSIFQIDDDLPLCLVYDVFFQLRISLSHGLCSS